MRPKTSRFSDLGIFAHLPREEGHRPLYKLWRGEQLRERWGGHPAGSQGSAGAATGSRRNPCKPRPLRACLPT